MATADNINDDNGKHQQNKSNNVNIKLTDDISTNSNKNNKNINKQPTTANDGIL